MISHNWNWDVAYPGSKILKVTDMLNDMVWNHFVVCGAFWQENMVASAMRPRIWKITFKSFTTSTLKLKSRSSGTMAAWESIVKHTLGEWHRILRHPSILCIGFICPMCQLYSTTFSAPPQQRSPGKLWFMVLPTLSPILEDTWVYFWGPVYCHFMTVSWNCFTNSVESSKKLKH